MNTAIGGYLLGSVSGGRFALTLTIKYSTLNHGFIFHIG
tara:strand:- start:2035 stop:2151 length:117 start_codon:yes stop_codon:yes gene_type:complete